MDGVRDFSVFLGHSTEKEKAAMAIGLVSDLLPHLDPDELSAVLRQADTRLRRDLLHGLDLPYKQSPSPAVCAQLIDHVASERDGGDIRALVRLGAVIRSACSRQLREIAEGTGLDQDPTDSIEVLEWANEQIVDIPMSVMGFAVTDWLMARADEPPSPFVIALVHEAHCIVPISMSTEGLHRVEDMLETAVAVLHDDADLRLTRHLANSTSTNWAETSGALQRVSDFADRIAGADLLEPIRPDLELLVREARRQRHIIQQVPSLSDLAADGQLNLQDLSSLIDELEAAVRERPGSPSELVQLAGPEELSADIEEIRALAMELPDDGTAGAALEALAAVIKGESTHPLEDLDGFLQEFPQWSRVALAAAGGNLSFDTLPPATVEGMQAGPSQCVAPEIDDPSNDDDRSAIPPSGDGETPGILEAQDEHRDFVPGLQTVDGHQKATATLEHPDSLGHPVTASDEVAPDTAPAVNASSFGSVARHGTSDQPDGGHFHEIQRSAPNGDGHDGKPDEHRKVHAGWDTTELKVAVRRALEDGRFGLAAHIADTDATPERALAFRLAALAADARAAAGPCASRFKDMLDAVEDLDDFPSRLVLLPAAIRMSLIAPYCGASALAKRLATTMPEMEPLVDASVRASQQGVALIEDVLAVAADLDEAARSVEQATDTIRQHLDTGPARTIKYQRATDVWKALIGKGGALHTYLAPAIAEHESSSEQLAVAIATRRRAANLASSKVRDAAIADADTSHPKRQIHSGAAARLADYWAESLEMGVAWADAVIATNRARTAEQGSWQQSALDALRSADKSCREHTETALDRLDSGDPIVRGAVCAARTLLASVRALLSGTRPDGSERDPDRSLNVDLLADAQFRVFKDFTVQTPLEPADGSALARIAQQPLDEGLLEAFHRRTEKLDHVGTSLILDVLRDLSHPELDLLESQRAKALSLSRAEVASRWSAARDRLEADRRLGFVDEAKWRSSSALLSDHDPADREDLDRVDAAIHDVIAELDANRDLTLADFRAQLDELEDDPGVAAARDKILARVNDGDLATAWEYVSLAREGNAIPEPVQQRNVIDGFYPTVDAALSDVNIISNSSRRAVANRERLGPLDFGALDQDDLAIVVPGLTAWRTLTRAQNLKAVELDRTLGPVLRMLGLSAQTIRRSAENRPKAMNHVWVDLIGTEVDGDPVVPTFAPEPGRHALRKILLSQGRADAVEGHIARARINDPIVVLHLGPLDPASRRRMANQFREARRAVAIIDDNLLAWIAATGPVRFEHTMRAVLPFVTTNPYMPDAYGLVPESMFYGRTHELDQIIRPQGGTSYVYGGRQLGKSALLRHAKRVFETDPDHVAIYLDLKSKQVGRPRPADAVWEELWTALVDAGVADGDMPARRLADRVGKAIGSWLDEQPGRRLLVLLDECDLFIEADTKGHLADSARLKGLMEETGRRCKIVFAGLHTVQRFSSIARGVANTPLAHLGDPLAIGPLDGRHAADLVTRPLAALGYEFESFELVNRILAHTNRQPALLVIFMHHLLERLNSNSRWRDRARPRVTADDVDSTWADPAVTAAIRERVSLTLRLDPAFHVIAHAVAYNHHVYGQTYRTPAAQLRDDCAAHWPAGFADMQMADFTLVADEMIGLGVLAKDGNSYMLRSPNVSRLLGSTDEIETVLIEAASIEPIGTFEPSRWRRDMTPTGTRRSRPLRSPLTDAQLGDIAANETQVRLVVATPASGLERVVDAIDRARSVRAHFAVREVSDPNITSYFRPLGDGRHRVTVVPVTGTPPDVALEMLARAVEAVDPDRRRNPQAGTFSIVVVADPVIDGVLVRKVTGTEMARAVPVSAAPLWTPEAIANFGRDTGLPFDSPEAALRVLDATGGWDLFVTEVGQWCAGGASLNIALERVDASRLATVVDLKADSLLGAAYDVAVSYIGDSTDPVVDVATFVAEDPDIRARMRDRDAESTARALVNQMMLSGLLVDAGDERVRVEPVARTAYDAAR